MPSTSQNDPFALESVFAGLIIACLIVIGGWIMVPSGPERGIFLAALCVKLMASVATVVVFQVFYIERFVNDNIAYHLEGVELAAEIRSRLPFGLWEHVSAALVFSTGTNPSSRIISLSGVLHLLAGDSFWGASFLCGVLGLIGQYMLYLTFRSWVADGWGRQWLRLGILFLPSVTFWSAALSKDAVGVLGLGCAAYGALRYPLGASVRPLLLAGGAYLIVLYRPQVLLPLLAALPVALWPAVQGRAARAFSRMRMGNALVGAVVAGAVGLALLAVVAVGIYLPRFSLANLPSEIVSESADYGRIEGGSNLEQPLVTDATWAALLAAWPLAVVTTYLRPMPWEAAGAFSILAAAENSVLAVLCARGLWQVGARVTTLQRVARSRRFWTCVVFAAALGLGVGASTPNLGSISRYRTPGMPFVVAALAVIESRVRRDRSSVQPMGQRGVAAVPS